MCHARRSRGFYNGGKNLFIMKRIMLTHNRGRKDAHDDSCLINLECNQRGKSERKPQIVIAQKASQTTKNKVEKMRNNQAKIKKEKTLTNRKISNEKDILERSFCQKRTETAEIAKECLPPHTT